jgi:hypothetical protein
MGFKWMRTVGTFLSCNDNGDEGDICQAFSGHLYNILRLRAREMAGCKCMGCYQD